MSDIFTYAEAATIYFPLITAGGTDFVTSASFVAADTQIIKDEAAAANTTNTPAHEGNGIYSLALTSGEMTANRIAVTCIDAATKVWEDQAVIIRTRVVATEAVNTDEIDGNATAATALAISMSLSGSVNDAGPTVSDFDGDAGLSATDDFYSGMAMLFTTGALAGLSRTVMSYNGTSKNFTFFRDWPAAPADTNAFTFVAADAVSIGVS